MSHHEDRDVLIMKLRAQVHDYECDLQFVERWAVHHGQKDSISPKMALSFIQHYPAITRITARYADAKHPMPIVSASIPAYLPSPWKTAIDEALIAGGQDCIGERETPEQALARLIRWEIECSTDPAIGGTRTLKP